MDKIITNRKIKILFEHNVQALFIVIGEMNDGYLAIEIDDINTSLKGTSIEEIDIEMKEMQESSGKSAHKMPKKYLSEEFWVADDDDLNLSIFDLINYKPSPEEQKEIDNNNMKIDD